MGCNGGDGGLLVVSCHDYGLLVVSCHDYGLLLLLVVSCDEVVVVC